MEIKIVKLKKGARLPQKATSGSAAYDVYVPAEYPIRPGRQIIPLGLSIEVPYGYEAKIEPRSGMSSKGMVVMQDVAERRIDADVLPGKIDSDYRGEIGVIVKSNEPIIYSIQEGMRIAQLTIYKVENPDFVEVPEISQTDRQNNGFGSTGYSDNQHYNLSN